MNMVARDYFSAFRISRIKERYGANYFSNWFFVIYLIFSPTMNFMSGDMRGGDFARFLATALLFLYNVWAAPLHAISLPKIMYLCPMDREERKRYLKQSYLFKIAMSMAITSFGVILIIVLLDMNVYYGVSVIAVMTLFTICSSNMDDRAIRKNLKERNSVYKSGNEDIWSTVNVAVSLFGAWIVLVCGSSHKEFSYIRGAMVAIVIVAIEIPLAVRSVRKAREIMDVAVDYER